MEGNSLNNDHSFSRFVEKSNQEKNISTPIDENLLAQTDLT